MSWIQSIAKFALNPKALVLLLGFALSTNNGLATGPNDPPPSSENCESSLRYNYVYGPKTWQAPARCQRGFGLCWLAAALNLIEYSLELRGVKERFSYDYLVYQYFRERAYTALDSDSETQLESLSNTGSYTHKGLSLIYQQGLLPEKLWRPGKLNKTSELGTLQFQLNPQAFIAKLKVLILIWRDQVKANKATPSQAKAGIDTFLKQQLGSWDEEFQYNGRELTPRDIVEKSQIAAILNSLGVSKDLNSYPKNIQKFSVTSLVLEKSFEEKILRQLKVHKLPIMVGTRWNSLSFGANPDFSENVLESLNIEGMPENLVGESLSGQGIAKALILTDMAISNGQRVNNLGSHAVLIVDAVFNPQGKMTHVVLLNSHGKDSGYNGHQFVRIEVFQAYSPTLWFLKEDNSNDPAKETLRRD